MKHFEKYFMAYQYMPTIFHEPHKNPPATPRTYLMFGPLSKSFSQLIVSIFTFPNQ